MVSTFAFDSVQHMLRVQFGLTQREDVQLIVVEPRSTRALSTFAQLPGRWRVFRPARCAAVQMLAWRNMGRKNYVLLFSGESVWACYGNFWTFSLPRLDSTRVFVIQKNVLDLSGYLISLKIKNFAWSVKLPSP